MEVGHLTRPLGLNAAHFKDNRARHFSYTNREIFMSRSACREGCEVRRVGQEVVSGAI